MNAEKFKNCIKNKSLQLTLWENFTHYLIVIYFLAASSVGIYGLIETKDVISFERSLYITTISLSVSLLFYYLQKRRLRFIIITTTLDRKQLREVIDYVASHHKWTQISESSNYYIATSYGGFVGGSWGERITILYYDNKIYFNSICDPDKKSSVTAWGRNKNHADLFFKAVKLLEADVAKRLEDKES